MQQQTLLALLLLALTALAAVGGGMKPREPFKEHEEPEMEEEPVVMEGEKPVVMEEEEKEEKEMNEEPVVMEDGSVEGFTGNMYAGF